ncbi:MAG TPA: PPK2 family polyphosphate kinase [Ilumatobacter sp.]|nr:PPK2 family polyphosphate kinase [Ilumatobacter sp.]
MPDTAPTLPSTKRARSGPNVVAKCRAGARVDLAKYDPAETFGWEKEPAKAELAVEQAQLAELVLKLYAEEQAGLLVVFQAVDAGGKGGTIRTVFGGLDPAAVNVSAFGVPSREEIAHDYLWRIHAHAPRRGTISVFDRSHYEDVLVVRVKHLAPEPVWKRRYGHIRDWERMLTDEGIRIVKFFLNTSKEEQRERFQDRIDDPDERWKFRLGDLDDRALWNDYQAAFQAALRETSTGSAPWYVVPGDRKWVRNLVVARILRHHLEAIDPQWPPAQDDIDGLIVE